MHRRPHALRQHRQCSTAGSTCPQLLSSTRVNSRRPGGKTRHGPGVAQRVPRRLRSIVHPTAARQAGSAALPTAHAHAHAHGATRAARPLVGTDEGAVSALVQPPVAAGAPLPRDGDVAAVVQLQNRRLCRSPLLPEKLVARACPHCGRRQAAGATARCARLTFNASLAARRVWLLAAAAAAAAAAAVMIMCARVAWRERTAGGTVRGWGVSAGCAGAGCRQGTTHVHALTDEVPQQRQPERWRRRQETACACPLPIAAGHRCARQ